MFTPVSQTVALLISRAQRVAYEKRIATDPEFAASIENDAEAYARFCETYGQPETGAEK